MPLAPRHLPPGWPLLSCILAIVLMAFAAARLTGKPWEERMGSDTTVGATSGKAAPKERLRYQATIENWRRYRAASGTEAR